MSALLDENTVAEISTEEKSQKEVGITKPTAFNGDRRRVKEFIQECNVYLDINEEIYKNDKLKVAFVLSLMNEKEARVWKAHFINKITGENMKINYPTFKEFLVKVEQAFKPADQAG